MLESCSWLLHTKFNGSPFDDSRSLHAYRQTNRQNLTLVGPCIVIYFYSKTNQKHNIANLFYFGTTLYMFRTVSPSIIRSLRLYIQQHTILVHWLLASKQPKNLYDIYLMLYVQS